MEDKLGFAFHVGCEVARAVNYGQSPMIDLCIVTRIEDGKLYLDNSKQPIRYPKRLLIIKQDPLYRMVKEFEKSKEKQ